MKAPSDAIRGVKSKKLEGKTIVLGVTGSIAAVETIKLARELIRHGAKVVPVMSRNACSIIHPNALEFATGEKPVVELSGKAEHVLYCGVGGKADLLLIAPCTANTISKIALGIDDTAVTTFATTAIGSKMPIVIVPAMHYSMYENKFVMENVEKCRKNGIIFVEPKIEEGKAKIAENEEIVEMVIRTLGKKDFEGKKVLVVGGGTSEFIDDVRIITNLSSGKMALALSKAAYERGADVEIWHSHNVVPPAYAKARKFVTSGDIINFIDSCDTKFDYITVPVMIKVKASKVVYVTAGLDFNFLQSANLEQLNFDGVTDVEEYVKSTDISANFGVGLTFEVSAFNLFIEGRYSQGLTNASNFPEGSDADIPLEFKNTGMQILFGVLYNFGE